MVINQQFFNGYSSNSSIIQSSVNSESGSSKTDNSQKTSVGLNNYYSSTISDNNKTKSKADSKRFSEVLNSEKNSNVNDSNKTINEKKTITTDSDKSSNIDKLKSKIEELKEKVGKEKCDENKLNDILAELLNALNNLLGKNEAKQNNDVLGMMTEQLNTDKNSENALLTKLLETLSNSEANGNLESDTLKNIKNLLNQLSASLNEEVSENVKKDISNIVSKLEEMTQSSNKQGKNVVTTEDVFKQNFSNENSSNDKNSGMLDKKDDSKEDKFLNSLIKDKNDSVDNKINLFTARTSNVQAPNTEVRGLTINKATFASDLIRDVRYMSVNNLKELTVKVNPGNLGEITIKLVQEDGVMKANLKANSKETTALLSQNLAEIKKDLGEQNIKISEVNIDLYNEDTTFFKNESFGSQLSQEQNNNSKGASQNNKDVNVNINENDEALEENLASVDNNLDFLA